MNSESDLRFAQMKKNFIFTQSYSGISSLYISFNLILIQNMVYILLNQNIFFQEGNFCAFMFAVQYAKTFWQMDNSKRKEYALFRFFPFRMEPFSKGTRNKNYVVRVVSSYLSQKKKKKKKKNLNAFVT